MAINAHFSAASRHITALEAIGQLQYAALLRIYMAIGYVDAGHALLSSHMNPVTGRGNTGPWDPSSVSHGLRWICMMTSLRYMRIRA